MSTIESLDDATLPTREDFSVCGTHWSASDRSTSRSYHPTDGKGTYGNPFGTDHPASKMKNETAAEHVMRVLRQSGVTRLINDICCDSVSFGISEPDTNDPGDKDNLYDNNANFNVNHAMLLRNSGKYAHECESVDTQDSLIRRQSLLSSKPRNPIHILEVQHKRKPRRAARSQTAPRQRREQNAFHMVAPYSTYTPRADGSSHGMGTEDGVVYRKFPSNGNLNEIENGSQHDGESISTKSTLTKRSKESLRSRERHSFSTTRYNMTFKNDDLPLPPRKSGRHRNPALHRRQSTPSRK